MIYIILQSKTSNVIVLKYRKRNHLNNSQEYRTVLPHLMDKNLENYQEMYHDLDSISSLHQQQSQNQKYQAQEQKRQFSQEEQDWLIKQLLKKILYHPLINKILSLEQNAAIKSVGQQICKNVIEKYLPAEKKYLSQSYLIQIIILQYQQSKHKCFNFEQIVSAFRRQFETVRTLRINKFFLDVFQANDIFNCSVLVKGIQQNLHLLGFQNQTAQIAKILAQLFGVIKIPQAKIFFVVRHQIKNKHIEFTNQEDAFKQAIVDSFSHQFWKDVDIINQLFKPFCFVKFSTRFVGGDNSDNRASEKIAEQNFENGDEE